MLARACVVAAVAAVANASDVAAQTRPCVVHARLDGVVNPAVADYLGDAVRAAERECGAALITIDTPGGDLASTRRIATAVLDAGVPVITYVAPGGARAGSAGMFIALAGHVAVMAPGTNIGASHPVLAGGGDPEDAGGEHLGRKVENDAAAFARAVAQARGRNVDWAEAAVRESLSATAVEARALGVIDLLAESPRALLDRVDGRVVSVDGRDVALDTRGAALVEFGMTLSQRVRALLGHPTVAYLLLIAGLLGLVTELGAPGLIAPGVLGAVALLLAAIGLDALPVRVGAVALIGVAVVMFIAELYVTSFGLLALGGVAALLTGSALLIDRADPGFFADPSVRVSWTVIAPMVAVVVAAVGALAWRAARVRRTRVHTGAEALVGRHGIAVTDIDGASGHVKIDGERWLAVASPPIREGEVVVVVRVDGLRLLVAPGEQEETQWKTSAG